MNLSIVIPAHNEAQRIGPMLDAYLPFFTSRFGNAVEFIVVINGTTDSTQEIVERYMPRFPGLRAIVEPAPIGKGGAVMMGCRAAVGDLIGYVDADGSTPPDAFLELVDAAADAPAVIASRWRHDSIVHPAQPLVRRIVSRVFNGTVRLLFRLRLTDTQCGAKVIRRSVLDRILPNVGITKWAFDVDLLFQIRRAGFSIVERPTVWHDVEGSKIAVTEASIEMLAALIRLRLLYSPLRGLVALYDRCLGPVFHPIGMERDRLFRHSIMLMAASQANNVISLLMQIAMIRTLSAQDYGVMAAMLAMLGLLSTPMQAVGGTVTHMVSVHIRAGDWAAVRGLVRACFKALTLFGIVLPLGLAATSGMVMRAFELPTFWPLVLVGIAIMGSIYLPIIGGLLTGAQRFFSFSIVQFMGCLLNLLISVGLVLLGLGALGPLTGHAVSSWFVAIAGAVLAFRLLPRGRAISQVDLGTAYRHFWIFLVANFCFLFLLSADVMFARYFLGEIDAGQFAKAASVARMIVVLPIPILSAMMPKVSSAGVASEASRRTLRKAIALMSILALAVTLPVAFIPRTIFLLFRRSPEPEIIEMLRVMPLVYAPLVGVQALTVFEISQRRFGVVAVLLPAVAVYVAGARLFHQTPFHLITVFAVSNAIALAGCLLWLRFRRNALTHAAIPTPG